MSREMKRSPRTIADWCFKHGLKAADLIKPDEPPISLPEFPDDDISVDEIRSQMATRFEKRQAYQKSKDWFPIKVNIKGPIGVSFMGDPHVDDDGCAWPL